MPWTAPRTWVVSEMATATIMNTHVRDNLAWLGEGEAWINATLHFWWLNQSGETCQYKKIGNWVVMRGRAMWDTTRIPSTHWLGGTATLFTLPVGYRPLKEHLFSNFVNRHFAAGMFGDLRIQADGDVQVVHTGDSNFGLTHASVGHIFQAEQ